MRTTEKQEFTWKLQGQKKAAFFSFSFSQTTQHQNYTEKNTANISYLHQTFLDGLAEVFLALGTVIKHIKHENVFFIVFGLDKLCTTAVF